MTSTNAADEFWVKVNATDRSNVKIVLVYTDYPGPVRQSDDSRPVLINDLDLEVQCENDTCEGELQSQSKVDNVESISLSTNGVTTMKVCNLKKSFSLFGPRMKIR